MKTSFTGICRTLSASPEKIIIQLSPKPDYARSVVRLEYKEGAVSINGEQFFYASHPIKIQEKSILCEVPEGDISWFVLSDTALEMNQQVVDQAKKDTQQEWDNVTSHITYKGPYEMEVRNSLRVLRLMTYAKNGGIIAAGTTSLPEVPGGERNYDYRYVWLRDAAVGKKLSQCLTGYVFYFTTTLLAYSSVRGIIVVLLYFLLYISFFL